MCIPNSDGTHPCYRYVVLLACFMVVFLSSGVGYGNVGIYHLYWIETFGEEHAKISMIGSLSIGLCSMLGPLSSTVTNIVGHRLAIIGSGLVSTASMLGAAFATNTTVLLICYGALLGGSWSFGFIPGFVASTFYFPPRHHAVVLGFCSSAMGLGPFVGPFFVEWLTEHYTWRGALIIQAGINLNIVVCGMTLLPRKEQQSRQNFLRFDLLKNPYYLNVILASFLSALGLSVIFVHLGSGVEKFLNVGNFESSLALSACGLGSFVGRLGHGIVAASPRINVIYQYIFSMTLMGTLTCLLPTAKNLIAVLILSCVIGLMVGAFSTIPGLIVTRIVTPSARTSAFGYQQCMLGLGLVVGAPTAGFLYSRTGNYAVSLYLGGAILLSAALVKLLVVRHWNRHLRECMRDIDITKTANVEAVEDADPDQIHRSLILNDISS